MIRKIILLILCGGLLIVGCQASEEEGEQVVGETAVPPTISMSPTATPIEEPTPTTEEPFPTATEESSTEPINLIFEAAFGGGQAGAWERANRNAYTQKNPHVRFTSFTHNLYTDPVPLAIHDGFLGNSKIPDVGSGYIVGNLRPYVEQGLITDISDLWQEQGWDNTFPESLKTLVSHDGKQYFVPQAVQWNPIWYRTDIFAELGLQPPETWDDLLATCDTLHEAGYLPIAVASSGWTPPLARWFTYINMRLNGPEFHERLMLGKEAYDDPKVKAVFEYWAELFDHNCFSPEKTTYRNAAQQILNGEAAMYNLGEWLSESYPDGLPDTFDFFTFPTIAPDVPRGEIVHVYGAYLRNDSENPEEAENFLVYLAGEESQLSLAEQTGRVVANLNVDANLYNDVYQRGLELVSDAEHITQLYEFNTHPNMARAGLRAFEKFYADQTDIDGILQNLEAERQETYEEN